MFELTLTTLQIAAISKIIMFIFVAATVVLIIKKAKPWTYILLLTTSLTLFYAVLSWKLQKMWWGNNGDEVFIFAFFTKVLSGQPFNDFYYGWLPPFYPPLYFWVVGTFSRLFTNNGITAAKIGVIFILAIWFILPYLWQKIFWVKIALKKGDPIIKSPWFWLLGPFIFFISLDFDNIIVKPYETLPALFCVILIGMVAENFNLDKWNYKNYFFIGLSGGILFLTYYFWWFVMIPALFFLALISKNKIKNLTRIIFIGIIIFITASPYLIPLLISFIKFGTENWQAIFFVPQNFYTFLPWSDLSLKSILLIAGLCGMLIGIKKNDFIKGIAILFLFCYFYQFLNIIYFNFGFKPFQADKPFLFLGTACLAVSSAYFIIFISQKYSSCLTAHQQKLTAIGLLLIFLPLLPFVKFIDDPVVSAQIEKDLTTPSAYKLSRFIKNNIPDYKERVWLSSGCPELNAYIPLSYYIAHNPHFSHQSVIYSKRINDIEKMSSAKLPKEFMEIIENGYPSQIDGLILYYDQKTNSYPLFFWQDNYPNGGKELIIHLPVILISKKSWEKIYDYDGWQIFLKNNGA